MSYFVERNINGQFLDPCLEIMANVNEVTLENRHRIRRNIIFRDAVSLEEQLRNMSGTERSLALAADQSGIFKEPPLIAAVWLGNLDIVNVLLKYKAEADVEVGGRYHGGQLSTISIDDNILDDDDCYRDDCVSFTCCTPLFLAAALGKLDVLRSLIENGADINASTADNCTPLMIAIESGNINVATFLIEHGANVHLKDDRGDTALHYAISRYILHNCNDSLKVCSCLIKHGADVNGCNNNKGPNNRRTPLMIASRYGRVDVMTLLIKHGADVNLQDKEGETALHHAVDRHTPLMLGSRYGQVDVMTLLIKHRADVNLQDKNGETALHYAVDYAVDIDSDVSCEALRCLIENRANVDAVSNNGCTSLMKAIPEPSVVTFLTEHGANIDLQDKNGDTALHYAVRGYSLEVVTHLVTLGSSHMCNNQGLTPLLIASDKGCSEVVEYLIKRPEITKEQRIDALELLGASIVLMNTSFLESHEKLAKGLKYIRLGIEERFSDPSHPLLKQLMEPVERKECQTLEELAQIEGDRNAVVIESVIIKERIIGIQSQNLLNYVGHAARVAEYLDFSTCTELHRHAVKMTQSINQSAVNELYGMSRMLHKEFMRSGQPKAKNHVVELLELTILEYETQHKVTYFPTYNEYEEYSLSKLFDISMKLVLFIAKVKFCGESKTSYLSTLLRKLCRKDPQDRLGNRLLHKVIEDHMDDEVYSCLDTVKLLVNSGFNVNAMNNKGSTPLHIAATFKPSKDKICLLTEVLQVLVDGGAHHDFVNFYGKTPNDMAKTDEAHLILSESRNLELQCISARAVRKYRIPYVGVVPVILEKYIRRHRRATPSREERLHQKYLHTFKWSIYEPF